MTESFQQRIALLASDRESGASEILDEVLSVFRDAVAEGVALMPGVTVLERIAESRQLWVWRSESRPALEGRRLAARLAASGIAVTCFSDAVAPDMGVLGSALAIDVCEGGQPRPTSRPHR